MSSGYYINELPIEDYCAKFPVSAEISSHKFASAILSQYEYTTPDPVKPLLLQRPGKSPLDPPPDVSGFLGGIWANEPANFQNFFKAYYKADNSPDYVRLADHFVKKGTAPLPIGIDGTHSYTDYYYDTSYHNDICLFWDTIGGKTGVYSERYNLETHEYEIEFITYSSHIIIALTGGGGGGSTGSYFAGDSDSYYVMGYHTANKPDKYRSVRLATGGCGGGSGACVYVLVNMRQLAETYRHSSLDRPCVQIALGKGGAGGVDTGGTDNSHTGIAGESGEASYLWIRSHESTRAMFELEVQGGLGGYGATINVVPISGGPDYKLTIDANYSRPSPTVVGTLYKSTINTDYLDLGSIMQIIARYDGVYGNVYGNTEGTEGYYDSTTGTPPSRWVCWEGFRSGDISGQIISEGKGTASFGKGFSSSASIILDQQLADGWNTAQEGWEETGQSGGSYIIYEYEKALTFLNPNISPFAKIKNSNGGGGEADTLAPAYTNGNNIAREAGFAIGGGGCGSIMAPGGDGGGVRSPGWASYYPTGTNGQWGSGGGGGASSLYRFTVTDTNKYIYELGGNAQNSFPDTNDGGNGGYGHCKIYYEN